MKLVYFSWVRERIGAPDEDIDLPPQVATAGDLLWWLRSKGENYAHALERPEVVRVAVDREHVDHRQTIAGAREIALFPPMTGG